MIHHFHVIFQFHCGTIKTWLNKRYIRRYDPFQFHCGTIKTPQYQSVSFSIGSNFNSTVVRLKLLAARKLLPTPKRFQFHCGTIKTAHFALLLLCEELFQFHCGTIKTNDETLRSWENTIISIPLWYD